MATYSERRRSEIGVGRGGSSPASPSVSSPSAIARTCLIPLAAAPVATFATWYGFLETGGRHPSIKLGGAMALAGAGIVALLVARPVRAAEATVHDHLHSALAELHPLRLGLAWASMSAG